MILTIDPVGLLARLATWAARVPLYLSLGHVLEIVMKEPGPDHPITITPNPHRIRVMLGGFIVAETTEALTLQEARLPPVLYIPRRDVRMDLLDATQHRTHCPYKGDAVHFTVNGGGLVRENAAWSYEEPFASVGGIAGHVAFYPNKVDAIEEFTD